jgi:hypothetical protein
MVIMLPTSKAAHESGTIYTIDGAPIGARLVSCKSAHISCGDVWRNKVYYCTFGFYYRNTGTKARFYFMYSEFQKNPTNKSRV